MKWKRNLIHIHHRVDSVRTADRSTTAAAAADRPKEMQTRDISPYHRWYTYNIIYLLHFPDDLNTLILTPIQKYYRHDGPNCNNNDEYLCAYLLPSYYCKIIIITIDDDWKRLVLVRPTRDNIKLKLKSIK